MNLNNQGAVDAMKGDLSDPENMAKLQYHTLMYGQNIQLLATMTKKADELIGSVIAKI